VGVRVRPCVSVWETRGDREVKTLKTFCRGRKRSPGFTLLEVLTATVMFAVIMSALYSVFHGALRLRETAYDAFEKKLPNDHVVEVLKDDLANILVPTGLFASEMLGEKDEKKNCRQDHLGIHTASGVLRDSEPWADIQRIEYYLEAPEDPAEAGESSGQDLIRSVTRNLLASVEETPEKESLLHGVQSFSVTYYDGQDWLDSWDSTARASDEADSTPLPVAIAVQIEFVPPQTGERETLPIEVVVPVVAKTVTPGASQSATGSSQSSQSGGTSGGKSGGTTGGTSGGTTGGKK